jgi:hypothetical protein
MIMTAHTHLRQSFAIAGMLALAACADRTLAPRADVARTPGLTKANAATNGDYYATLAEVRRATARYHDVEAALADGFVPLVEECEDRAGEGRVGIPYANFARVLDGVIDPSKPDALLYEPGKNGRMNLVAAELAIPYALWSAAAAPTFLGATFQREDEFGVFGLHIWVWRENPNGTFAIANPNVSCKFAE